MAYTYNGSSGTKNVNLQTSLTGSSGGCAVSSSAVATSGETGHFQMTASGPNNVIGVGAGGNNGSAAETFIGPGSISKDGTGVDVPVWE